MTQPASEAGAGRDRPDREERLIGLAKQRVLREGDFAEASRLVAREATGILDVSRVGIWLFDEHRSSIVSSALFDERRDGFIEGGTVRREQCPQYFAALDDERTITADEVETDPRMTELWEPYWKPNGVFSSLDAPIRAGDVAVGVVCIESRVRRAWTVDDIHRASTIADLVAIAYEVSERRKAEVELSSTALLQRIVTQISARFVSLTPDETVAAVEQALHQLGEALSADTGFVFRYSPDLTEAIEVLEWNSSGRPKLKALQGLAMKAFGWWIDKVRERENIVVPDFNALSVEAGAERKLAEMVGIRSLVAVPMVSGPTLVGLLGLASGDVKDWSDISVGLLRVCGEVIAAGLERKRVEEALRDSEQRYRHLFEHNLAGVFRSTPEGEIVECNDACARVFGFESAEELMSVGAGALYRDVDERRGFIARLEEKGTLRNAELPLRRRDGTDIWVIENASLVTGTDGRRYVEGAMFDITEMKRAQEAVRESEERYRLLFEQNPAGVFRASKDGEIRVCNQACARILGYDSPEDLKRANIVDLLVNNDTLEDGVAAIEQFGEIVNVELELRRQDGSTIWVLANVMQREDETGSSILEGGLVDITKRKEAEGLIEYQAYHDSLTGLPNRNLLRDRLKVALAGAKRNETSIALLFIDLDEFKLVNDTLGHTVGDQLLQLIAKRIEQAIREEDTVARMGGDEFTVLASGIDSEKAAVLIAQKLIDEIAVPLEIEGHILFPTASIGIATYPNDGGDSDALLRQSDMAMYRAKDAGRNNYQLATPAMNERAVARLSLERHLRDALDRNEFELYFQPQVDVVGHTVVGVEALIRWNHPEQGVLSPGAFIPIAEETRLIVPIGDWVARQAFDAALRLSDAGLDDVRVSFNLSARLFRKSDLVKSVGHLLSRYRVEPERIELEITESIAMQSTEWTLETLRALKSLGVLLAIDDFGTGYSSLNYLKQFPIDRLKIDRSFVCDLETSESDAAIVSAIIALAESLRIETIAEGVEEEAQRRFLTDRGCREMQGFFFARPLPWADLLKFIDRWNGDGETS